GNLPLCYNPNSNTNGIYFLSFQQCDAAGNPIGNEAMKWLTMLESQKLHELDAKTLSASAGMNLTAGNYYRIKMATSNPWTEKVRIIYINPCVNAPDFTINGISRTDLTPINVSYNGALPTLKMNIDKSTSCTGFYDLFIKPCDAAGNPIGWSSNEVSITHINTNLNNHMLKDMELQYFLHTFYSYTLQPNQHYLIRLSTYDVDWNFNAVNIVSKSVVVYMPSCNEVLDFKVNDESRTDFTPIAILPNDSIYVSLYPAITCSNEYLFSIEPCTSTGDGSANGSADEVSEYQSLLFQDKFKHVAPLSLVKFCKKNNVQLTPGSYYRLKLSNPLTGGMKVVIIYIRQPYCVPPASGSGCYIDRFEFNGFAFQSGFNGGYKDYSDHGLSDLANYTPQVYSGSTMPIQVFPRGRTTSPVMRYCRIWIDGNDDGVFQTTEQVYQTSGTGNFLNQSFVIPYYSTIGKKRMRVAVSLVGYPTPCGNGNTGETEDYSLNVQLPPNPRFAAIDSTVQSTGFVCYPNPSNGNFSIQYTLDVQKDVSINLYDSQGRLVQALANEAAKTEGTYTLMLTDLNLAAGTYIVVMQAGDEVKTQKLIVQ
ncbi:MAG: GEVED domain-containing protein, partial [Bacteroidia bacterium]